MPSTQDYILTIRKIRLGKSKVHFDFSRFPADVDVDAIRREIGLGLSDKVQTALSKAKAVDLDFSKIPEPSIGRQIGPVREVTGAEVPISRVEETAFLAERLAQRARPYLQPESLAFLPPEMLERLGVSKGIAEFISSQTDPTQIAMGTVAGIAAGPAIRPIVRYAGKPIGKAVGLVQDWLARRRFHKQFLETVTSRPTPGRVILPGERAPTTVIRPGEAAPSEVLRLGPTPPAEPLIVPSAPARGLPTVAESRISRVNSMVGEVPEPTKIGLGIEAERQLIDRYAAIRRLVGQASTLAGKPVTFEADPYKAARLYSGIAGRIENRLDKMREILAPVRNQSKILETYMLSMRAIERAERGFKNPEKVSAEEAAGAIREIRETYGEQTLNNLRNTYLRLRNEIGDGILRNLEDAGVLKKGATLEIKKKNQFWVPFDVLNYLAENQENVLLGRRALSVGRQDIVKYLTGTEKKIRSPIDSLIIRMSRAEGLAERNRVVRKLADMAKIPGMEKTILEQPKVLPLGYKTVPYFKDGVATEIAVPKPVADAISGMKQESADLVTRLASTMSAALRMGATTLNIPFILFSNPIRDFQTLSATSGKGLLVVRDWIRGFAEAIGRDQDFRDFREYGGAMSGIMSQIKAVKATKAAVLESPLIKAAKTISNPINLIQEIGQAIELAPRLAAYKIGLSRGMSKGESTLFARNATVDFARMGDVGRIANMWVPFLNARLQGSLVLAEAIKQRPAKTLPAIASTIMLPGYATYAYNKTFYPEIYDRLDPVLKENYFTIVRGEKKNKYGQMEPDIIKIPKGDVGRIFWNPLEFFLDWGISSGKDVLGAGLKLLSDISPVEFEMGGRFSGMRFIGGLLPPMARGVIETYTGKNFYFQSDVVPKWLQDVKTKSLQYTDRTPKSLVWLGEKTGLSPVVMENFLRTSFGTGVFQFIDPTTVHQQFLDKLTKGRYSTSVDDLMRIKKDLIGEKADKTVMAKHSLAKIMTGNKMEQNDGIEEVMKILSTVPAEDRRAFIRRIVESQIGRQLPAEERVLRQMGKKQRKEVLIRLPPEVLKRIVEKGGSQK